MTTATIPPNPQTDEVCVEIKPNERGGYSILALGHFALVDIGNYATYADARRCADYNGFTVLNEPC